MQVKSSKNHKVSPSKKIKVGLLGAHGIGLNSFAGPRLKSAFFYCGLSLLVACSNSSNPPDTTPDTLTFTEKNEQALDVWVTSDAFAVSGVDSAVPVSVSGGEYAIDGGAFTAEPGVINPGQTIQLRQRTASDPLALSKTTLKIGQGSSTFSTTTLDAQYPIASISFPPRHSFTSSRTLTVRGKTVDRQGDKISDVRVNGKTVTTLDDFANWEIELDLTAGENPINIQTTDDQGEQGPETEMAKLYASTAMPRSHRLIMDSTNDALYTLDETLGAVVKFNLDNGSRSILSGAGVPDDVNLIPSTQGFALDIANNRLLLVNIGSDALLAIDLSTGARSLVSDNSAANSEYAFELPVNVVLDTNANRALVADDGLDAIVAVNLATGQRSVLSDATTPDAQNPLDRPRTVILDEAANRLLSIEFTSGVLMAIDLSSGQRTVISDATTPNALNMLERAQDMVLDADNNRVLVVDSSLQSLLAIDLATGQRTVLSNNQQNTGNAVFVEPTGIALDTANSRALVMDRGSDSLLEVNLDTGDRQLLSVGGQPRANRDHLLLEPLGLLFDKAKQRLLLADPTARALFAIDANTGRRTVISDKSSAGSEWAAPISLLKGKAEADIWVVDSAMDTVFNLNLDKGERTVLTDNNSPNNDVLLDVPLALAMGRDTQRLIIADTRLPALVALNTTTGARSVFSSNQIPDALNPFCCLSSITYDASHLRFLVATYNADIIAVDESTGARTVFSSSLDAQQGPEMDDPTAMAIDQNNNRLYVVDEGLDALFAVDLNTGMRRVISDSTTPNRADGFAKPYGLALDLDNNRAFVTSVNTWTAEDLGMIIAVDLSDGQRVILSR